MPPKSDRFVLPSDAELRANKDVHLNLFVEAEALLEQLRGLEEVSEPQSMGLPLSPFDSPMPTVLESFGARPQQPTFRFLQDMDASDRV
jgi:hypothetical protein